MVRSDKIRQEVGQARSGKRSGQVMSSRKEVKLDKVRSDKVRREVRSFRFRSVEVRQRGQARGQVRQGQA